LFANPAAMKAIAAHRSGKMKLVLLASRDEEAE
jgi:hypothetical protein